MAHNDTNLSEANDVMKGWKDFFRMTEKAAADKKGLYAMGKLTQIAFVNFMRLRGVYNENIFTERKHEDLTFYVFNVSTEEGSKLDGIMRTIGNCINISIIKAVRFQMFHDPEKPNEIGEELFFKFYYGQEQRVELDFGDNVVMELDMSDCNFESFLRNFKAILNRINDYCAHMSPLPNCYKLFRTSFCKEVPVGFDMGEFNIAATSPDYAPGIVSSKVGSASLSGVAVGAILRTCYSTDKTGNT